MYEPAKLIKRNKRTIPVCSFSRTNNRRTARDRAPSCMCSAFLARGWRGLSCHRGKSLRGAVWRLRALADRRARRALVYRRVDARQGGAFSVCRSRNAPQRAEEDHFRQALALARRQCASSPGNFRAATSLAGMWRDQGAGVKEVRALLEAGPFEPFHEGYDTAISKSQKR